VHLGSLTWMQAVQNRRRNTVCAEDVNRLQQRSSLLALNPNRLRKNSMNVL